MNDAIRSVQAKLGLFGSFAIASLFVAVPTQAQVTEAETAEINQYYLDAYAILDAAFADPAADGAVTFGRCVQQMNGLIVPEYMLTAAQAHDFNGYGEAEWVGAFCDRVHLNYIFFATGPKFN